MAPPLAAAEEFPILESIAGNRRIPNAVIVSLLDSLSSHSALPRTSQRLHQTLVLRALDAALQTEGASSSLLLHKARKVLADADASACSPHRISFTDNEENVEARAAASMADLKRLLDLEWANLPPSMLELAIEIAGDGAHQTCAAADHTNVGEPKEREILAKHVQAGSASHLPILKLLITRTTPMKLMVLHRMIMPILLTNKKHKEKAPVPCGKISGRLVSPYDTATTERPDGAGRWTLIPLSLIEDPPNKETMPRGTSLIAALAPFFKVLQRHLRRPALLSSSPAPVRRSRTRSARPAAPRRRWSIRQGRRCWSAAAPPSPGVCVRMNVSRRCDISPLSPSPGAVASRLRPCLHGTPYLRPDRIIRTPVLFSKRSTNVSALRSCGCVVIF